MAIDLPTPATPPKASAQKAWLKAHKHWLKGQDYASRLQWGSALSAFEQACAWQSEPAYGIAAIHAAIKAGQSRRAVEVALQLHSKHPMHLLAYTLESHAWLALGQPEEAVRTLHSMPSTLSKDHDAWLSLGVSLQRLRRHPEAVQAFMIALTLRMDRAIAHFRLGMSFKDMGLKAESAECVRTAITLGLGTSELAARAQLLFLEREACRWQHAHQALEELNAALALVRDGQPLETGPFSHAVLVADPLAQLKVSQHYAAHVQRSVQPLPKVSGSRGAGRIKLGYASADFHHHATSQLMVQMLESHDRNRFEVTLFSTGPDDGSAMRHRVRASSEHFVDLHGKSLEWVAQQVRQRSIDILVDLKGATHDTLLPVFACQPAPLQVTWLGFPGTTGAKYIDYIVGDPVVTPLCNAGHFSEAIAQMPVCYQPNDTNRPRPAVRHRSAWGVPEGALLLCGFHQSYKISTEVFDVWCRLLHAEPRAKLWLLQWNMNVQNALLAAASARGISGDRLLFAPVLPLEDHLSRLGCADVYLDTWPCNAHTTAGESLWMGVPVVTLIGSTFAQRVAASLLNAVQMPQCVCDNVLAYENKVLSILRDEGVRHALRKHLSQQQHSRLFDGRKFAKDFEALLLRMWQLKLQGVQPRALAAEADSKPDEVCPEANPCLHVTTQVSCTKTT